MDRDPSENAEIDREFALSDPDRLTRILKLALIVTGLLVLVGAGVAFWLNQKSEKDTEAWNYFGALRGRYDARRIGSDWEPSAKATEDRDSYQLALESFLEKKPGGWDGAIEPHVRWRIAKAAVDQLIAGEKIDSPEERQKYFDRAQQHLEVIRDSFKDFPLNWEQCRTDPDGAPTLTRQLLQWLEANRGWETKYRARSMAPDGAYTLLVRTNRGDMRIRCYGESTKTLVDAVVNEVNRGTFDGRAIVTKQVDGPDDDPYRSTIHTGNAASKDAKPYERDTHKDVTEAEPLVQLLPAKARHQIIAERGTVMAWHGPLSPYDEPSQLVFVAKRSPALDHNFTPIGKLLDDASLATLDRIFKSDTWADDEDAKTDDNYTQLSTTLQVPVRIVKVLAYDGDALVASTSSDGGTTPPTATEKSLKTVKQDAYKVDPPEKPTPAPEKGDEDNDDAEAGAVESPKDESGSPTDGN